MRILLIATDLYRANGGGQTVYRRIIEETPDCQFHYFLAGEDKNASRPSNAYGVPLRIRRRVNVGASCPLEPHLLQALETANQIARSVAGQHFDIVDIPDFVHFGAALRTAFAHHNVTVEITVLALHGNCSTSREMNWGTDDDPATRLSLQNERLLERMQFDAADGAYGLSMRYIEEWQQHSRHPIHYIDPLHFAPRGAADGLQFTAARPSIYCVGRSERRKGNDIFVELARWLRRDSYTSAAHIGDEDCSRIDKSSPMILQEMANHRGLEIPYCEALTWHQLSALYRGHAILILPVRYDTLNLVALEALFSGCPVAISSKAGVCDYLDTVHPRIPYVKIDLDNLYSAVGPIQDLIDNYPKHRQNLQMALANTATPSLDSLDIEALYRGVLDRQCKGDAVHDVRPFPCSYTEGRHYFIGHAIELARGLLARTVSRRVYAFLRSVWLEPKQWLTGYMNELSVVRLVGALSNTAVIPKHLRLIAQLVSQSGTSAANILLMIHEQGRSQLFRCNYYLLIAEVERTLGHELNAVTYELRILRLLGSDKLQLLPRLVETLRRLGFDHEASAALAMYADPQCAEQSVYRYLQDAREAHRVRHDKSFEVLDDRRTGRSRVAVIVSLYKAASKLTLFLTAVAQQTLVKQGAVEIILIDSGSPDVEGEVVREFLPGTPLNAVYARSAERETIQAAWNRGIGLATAPYLVFLGVDETLYPEALEVLADELDRNPDIDWVMGNSLVTAVNARGVLERDIMTYDRTGACKDLVYLETCYLSWVGGMYRKNVHDRFGYYDESFGAAGDTEFKNRVLPGLKVKFIPRMLGLFLNYPDERTTASPRAEIEDLRAWYIHRTPAGIRYAFENRPIEDAQRLLGNALGYRKSFCSHVSSDVDYASHLADYMIDHRNPEDWVKHIGPGLREFLRKMRQLEFLDDSPSMLQAVFRLAGAKRFATRMQSRHDSLIKNLGYTPCYDVYNDNRYEQHSWLWKS